MLVLADGPARNVIHYQQLQILHSLLLPDNRVWTCTVAASGKSLGHFPGLS